jgi:hypothetical protein
MNTITKNKMKKIILIAFVWLTNSVFAQKDTTITNFVLLGVDSSVTIQFYKTPKTIYSTYDTKKLKQSNIEDFLILDLSPKTLAEKDSLEYDGKSSTTQEGVTERYNYPRNKHYNNLFAKAFIEINNQEFCLLKLHKYSPEYSPKYTRWLKGLILVKKNGKWYSKSYQEALSGVAMIFGYFKPEYVYDIFVNKKSDNAKLDDLIKTSIVNGNIDFTQFFQKMDTKNQEDKNYYLELLDTMLK